MMNLFLYQIILVERQAERRRSLPLGALSPFVSAQGDEFMKDCSVDNVNYFQCSNSHQ